MSRYRILVPLLATFSLATLLPSSPALAADSDFVVAGGMDFAFKNLDLYPGSTKLSTQLTTLNPSVAIGYKSFYASLAYDKTVSSEPSTEVQESNRLATVDQIYRSDILFTLGYRPFSFMSVFVGYLHADNHFNLSGARSSGGTASPTIVEGNYIEYGGFAGVSFSHSFGSKGTLAVTAAWASLSGAIDQTSYYAGPPATIDSSHEDFDTSGLSYSIIWTGPLVGSLHYRVGAKFTSYQGDNVRETSDTSEIKEKYTTFFLGVMNYF